MDENKIDSLGQAEATPVTNPTIEVAKILSNEILRVFELKEYCKFIESDLQKCYKNVGTLASAKSDRTKAIAEYKSRDKINATNSESLLRALNELYKYKCEMKSYYLATQKALKSKKLKCKQIISSYESAWDNALKGYNAETAVKELHEMKQENTLLEQEIQKQEKLISCTKIDFVQLKQHSEKTFLEKAVNFSNVMVEYRNFLRSTKRNKKSQALQDSKGNFEFTLFKPEIAPFSRKEFFSPDSNDDANLACSFDVSVFDDIMVPSENLESQNLEEDVYSFGQIDERQLSDVSKDHEECLEYSNNYQQTVVMQCKASAQESNENSVQDDSKVVTVNENESQYFRTDLLESLKRAAGENAQAKEQWHHDAKNLNETKNKTGGSAEKLTVGSGMLHQMENFEEAPKDLQMESEESLSEATYEKQFRNQRAENYEYQYQKTSSVSSDDMPGENINESPGPSRMFCEQDPNFKARGQLKEKEINSFTGFFTTGTDQDTSKPSIFKLF